jgi:hypothetical protein
MFSIKKLDALIWKSIKQNEQICETKEVLKKSSWSHCTMSVRWEAYEPKDIQRLTKFYSYFESPCHQKQFSKILRAEGYDSQHKAVQFYHGLHTVNFILQHLRRKCLYFLA